MSSSVSYYALRVCPRSGAQEWWNAARRAEATAPAAIRALLVGRTRVELSQREARDALAWAAGLDGWGEHALPPVWIYPMAPMGSEP